MSTPDEDVEDAFRAPEAALREDLPPRSYLHPLVGFAAGLLVVPTVYGINDAASMVRVMVSAAVAALALATARRLDWKLAIPLGYGITFLLSIAVYVVSRMAGL